MATKSSLNTVMMKFLTDPELQIGDAVEMLEEQDQDQFIQTLEMLEKKLSEETNDPNSCWF